jgi:hemolysin III
MLEDITTIHYDIKNRLDYNTIMYCEGCAKPLMRGFLHGIISLIIPIPWFFIVNISPTLTGKLLFSFYVLCNFYSYITSYLYHVHSHKYGPEIENFVLKLDRLGIFIKIAANFSPVSLLFLKNTGIYLLSLQWILTFIGSYRIFFLNRSLWWEPLLVGGVAIFFIPELWEVMTPPEFWLTMSSYIVPTFGIIFTIFKINLTPFPEIWGYHENFHFFDVLGSIIVYSINYSLASRSGEICWDY